VSTHRVALLSDSHHLRTDEDQKDEAKRRSEDFRANRVPKFLKHFDAVIASNSSHSGFLVGTTLTTADLTLFHVRVPILATVHQLTAGRNAQTLTGLRFSFPQLMSALEKGGQYKSLFVFEQTLAADPRIKDYVSSDRRRQFSNGLFRKYDELDGEA
jgi:glutathione S-transferase